MIALCKPVLVLFSLLCAVMAQAQTDSSAVKPKSKKPAIRWFTFKDVPHSPTKASVYSAILPGLGQAYNKKYWKIPIVYGALIGGAYTIIDNRSKMRKLNEEFRVLYANNSEPTAEQITKRNEYRQSRDVGILVVTAFYALQIVDATVDAHFFNVDLNENLNVTLKPSSQFLNLTCTF